MIIVYLCTGC